MRLQRRLVGVCGYAFAAGVDTASGDEQGTSAYSFASGCVKGGEADGRQGETPRIGAEARGGDE